MSNQIEMNGAIPLYTSEDALFMRPKTTPVQVTEAIRRSKREVAGRVESDSLYLDTLTQETLQIILEFHLDDVLGHGEEAAFTGN